MLNEQAPADHFPSSREEAAAARDETPDTPQTRSHAFQLAFSDTDFLVRPELRPVRLQLELLKPDLLQAEQNIHSTVVLFGSARIPCEEDGKAKVEAAREALEASPKDELLKTRLRTAKSLAAKQHFYDQARELARIISSSCQRSKRCDLVVITGGGPGIMEAGNRGAHDVSAKSIGLNIVLPHEQAPNEYITPELCFQFHYFAIRKMHFLLRAKALVAFPGGFGTLDELFEALTLIQTTKVKPLPVLLFGKEWWTKLIDFQFLVDEGTISPQDLDLFQFVETAEEAWEIISRAPNTDCVDD